MFYLQVLGRCVCSPGYASVGCSVKLPVDSVVYSTEYDPHRVGPARAVNESIARYVEETKTGLKTK